MYDLPEVRNATDAWWAGIAKALRREGVSEAPEKVARTGDVGEQWRSASLLLSQCCGYPLTHEYKSWLKPVGTPCFTADGCEGPNYSSVIVVGAENKARDLADLRNGVAAFSSTQSHSGYNCFRATIAPLADGGSFFSKVIATGAHPESIALVAGRKAYVATVDCVTYALCDRYRPDALDGTRKLGYTMNAPGLPYVTHIRAADDLVERLQTALREAFKDPDLTAAREALFLSDIAFLGRGDYARVQEIEDQAFDLGLPELR
jgi:ABC-type phosphate/phosphonate transport system substrate-binding protein